jgi:hypothetical protein
LQQAASAGMPLPIPPCALADSAVDAMAILVTEAGTAV